jgi:excinuclease ABC subunit C
LIGDLSDKMTRAAKEKRFEDAARLRDQILALSAMNKGARYFDAIEEHEDLRRRLGLDKPPQRIEAFDISNISGQDATGSMVSFYNGKPDKNNYRRFMIKTVAAIDDYAMIREVVRRRYTRLKAEKRAMPDLIVIDGGKQHLRAAEDELEKLGLDLAVMSIAKEEENIYSKGKREPLHFPSDAPALNLVRRVRDEAHRFARKYHHLLHKKKTFDG